MTQCLLCKNNNIKIQSAEFVPFLIERMFLGRKQQTNFLSCQSCKVRFSSYRPTDKEMARLYSGYRNTEYQKQRQKHEPRYTEELNYNLGNNKEILVFRKKRLLTLLESHIDIHSIENVLDFGGDTGQSIPDILGKNKYVYDISNSTIPNCKKNGGG